MKQVVKIADYSNLRYLRYEQTHYGLLNEFDTFMETCFIVFIIVLRGSMWFIPIFSRVASLALGQSSDCPSACEVTLKDMGKMICAKAQQTTTDNKVVPNFGKFCISNNKLSCFFFPKIPPLAKITILWRLKLSTAKLEWQKNIQFQGGFRFCNPLITPAWHLPYMVHSFTKFIINQAAH